MLVKERSVAVSYMLLLSGMIFSLFTYIVVIRIFKPDRVRSHRDRAFFYKQADCSFRMPSTMAIVVSDVWLRTAYDAIPARNGNGASILTPQTICYS